MSYKILEQNGIDNENIDGAAFNNFSAGNRDGIIKDVLNECELSSTGNIISVAAGEMILHGFRVKITAPETLSAASAPAARTEYQIVAQVTLSDNHAVAFTLFFQLPQALVQNPMFDTDLGTYQAELGRFYQETDGAISGLRRTLPVIYADSERYAEEAKAAAEQAQAAAEEAQDGAAQAMLDIPLSPEQTGAAITGENTLAGAGVSVEVASINLVPNPTNLGQHEVLRDFGKNIHLEEITINFDVTDLVIANQTGNGSIVDFQEEDGTHHYITALHLGIRGDQSPQTGRFYYTYRPDPETVFSKIIYTNNNTYQSGTLNRCWIVEGDSSVPYTPYVTDGTSVNVTACGGNVLYTADGTVQNGDYVVSANNGEITFTRGETYVGIWKISNEIGWSTTGNYINDWKDETVYGGSAPLVLSWSYEGNIDRTGSELYPRIVPIYKDGTANDQIQVFARNSITLEAKPIAAIALFMSDTIPDGWKIKVQLSKTTNPYTPYTGATYPATVGQSVEIVQYDKITNVFTDNAGVTVSASFKQSTRYELDTKPVSLAGTYAERPTGTYPYVVLYTATDRNGETYRLEANTDGSVSANWVQINGIYQHNIVMSQATGPFFSVTIRSRDNYAYAFSRLIEWLNGKGLNVQGKDYSDVAGAFKNDSGELHIISHMRANGSGLQVSGVNITTGNVADFTINEAATCIDTVITI